MSLFVIYFVCLYANDMIKTSFAYKNMDTFSLDRITLATVFDTRRVKESLTQEVDGHEVLYYPVKYRVTFEGKQFYYPSGIDLTETEWERLPKAKDRELKEKRQLIQSGFDKIKDHIKVLVKDGDFSIEALRIRLGRGDKKSVVAAFDNRIETLRKEGKIGTADWYFYTLQIIGRFTTKPLKFKDITVHWLKSFEAFLYEDGKKDTSVSMYMRALRAIVNEGKKLGEITQAQYPFGLEKDDKYEIPEPTGRRLALTLPQIKSVIDYPLNTDVEKRCRDMWFFSYLCNGINNDDLLRLKFKNIVNGEIRWYRHKTITTTKRKKEIVATLTPVMRELIKRWGSSGTKPETYLFPYLIDTMTPEETRTTIKNFTSLQNKKMRAIGRALEYGDISSYWARHSYATVMKRSGVNIAFISESLGHTDMKTTADYLDSFDSDARATNAAALTNFDNK